MSQLTASQVAQVAAYWANVNFVLAKVTANFGLDQIEAAASSLDSGFDTTFNDAVAAVGGNLTVIQALQAALPAPFNTASVQGQTQLACYVLMKRAGII